VATILSALTPAPTVRILDLIEHAPELPEKGDLADILSDDRWCGLPLSDAAEAKDLAAMIERLAQAVEPLRPKQSDDLNFRLFPIDALPDPIRGFVAAGAKAIGCDPSYLALPLLVAIAAAIGNTRRLELKRGWSVPPILWGAVVGESGTAKTPAFRLVMQAVRERQRKALERHAADMKKYEADFARWEKNMAAWKRAKNEAGEPPAKPDLPQADRCVVSDTTIEALAPILLSNPRGLLLARDELSGWIGSFDRYLGKGKAGTDEANWLSMHNGDSIIVDRKTGLPRTVYVPHAAVCVTGGIQPAILRRALGTEHRESGLAARLPLTWPPRKAKRWTEAEIDPSGEGKLVRLFDKLYELEMIGPEGEQPPPALMQTSSDDSSNDKKEGREKQEGRPALVKMSTDAKEAWTKYYNSHADEQADLTGDLSAAWSKLEEYAARLALVIHHIRFAMKQCVECLDVESMTAGIRLAEWFKHEARRVYAMLAESNAESDLRRLAEWILGRCGSVTPREVQMGCRCLRGVGDAESALNALAKAGRGSWREIPPSTKGGRPSTVFTLSSPSTSTEPPDSQELDGFR
jgi:hypothetical protein